MNYIDDHFLLITAEQQGCYMCDSHCSPEADIYDSIEKVVNHLNAVLKSNGRLYPVALYLIDDYDGEILENMKLGIDAGCIGGLYEINFKYNKMTYKIKRKKNI